MVLPTKVKPRFFRSFDMASETGVLAGTWFGDCKVILYRLAIDETPQVVVQAQTLFKQGQVGAGIFYEAIYFELVANDAGIAE